MLGFLNISMRNIHDSINYKDHSKPYYYFSIVNDDYHDPLHSHCKAFEVELVYHFGRTQ